MVRTPHVSSFYFNLPGIHFLEKNLKETKISIRVLLFMIDHADIDEIFLYIIFIMYFMSLYLNKKKERIYIYIKSQIYLNVCAIYF